MYHHTFKCALAVFVTVIAGCSTNESGNPRHRVGVYDSRAIAIAFVGSEVYQETDGKILAELNAEYARAKTAGDHNRMAELEAQGQAQQDILHNQGFGTAPVDEILKHIEDQLPGIAEDAEVEAIVSKWDKDSLARYEDVELVDVTMSLVDALGPTDRQRKSAIEIQKNPPVLLREDKKIDN